ncbi:unnamed protein product [Vicia faba]|uniref:Uncharacterized protein n=1 Tax=Vicia faba TaxID=3906 RepID=A0AAV1AQZ0_VICFA|nr:unnamed protein product [Vicia faba]
MICLQILMDINLHVLLYANTWRSKQKDIRRKHQGLPTRGRSGTSSTVSVSQEIQSGASKIRSCRLFEQYTEKLQKMMIIQFRLYNSVTNLVGGFWLMLLCRFNGKEYFGLNMTWISYLTMENVCEEELK